MPFNIRNFSRFSLWSMGFSQLRPVILKEELIPIGQYPIEGLGRPPRNVRRRGDESGRVQTLYDVRHVGEKILGNIECLKSKGGLLPSKRTVKKVVVALFVLSAAGLVVDQFVRDARGEDRIKQNSNSSWRGGSAQNER